MLDLVHQVNNSMKYEKEYNEALKVLTSPMFNFLSPKDAESHKLEIMKQFPYADFEKSMDNKQTHGKVIGTEFTIPDKNE